MPTGRELPAVTKNRNYPQPVKQLKPMALGLEASPAVPASPRGSREDLDNLDTIGSEPVEQGKSLEDPGVVRARVNTSFVGCPADTADRLGDQEFAVASRLPFECARARAVDCYNCRPVLSDNVNDLPARQVALERQNPAVIDDRGVEALSLPAYVNADPNSHTSKHAPPPSRSHPG